MLLMLLVLLLLLIMVLLNHGKGLASWHLVCDVGHIDTDAVWELMVLSALGVQMTKGVKTMNKVGTTSCEVSIE